ncbi:UDP-glucose 6-dehydrogenase 3 [Acorus gramineus]|uniref:UDP-glucose 6-dehydrogenase 3 n=1 Tax=Acorus gramineus TaxID=55184 RepID=A0AAV9B4Z5_ACOGR|nr:UDP-glucose 6-dehydrogenase 3 [Acorus gramineus]
MPAIVIAFPSSNPDSMTLSASIVGANLRFSSDVESHVANSDIIFIFVNTPTHGLGADKTANLIYWESVVRMITDDSHREVHRPCQDRRDHREDPAAASSLSLYLFFHWFFNPPLKYFGKNASTP